MKSYLPLLLLVASMAGAEVAVRFYSEEPTSHPNRVLGIPTNAPSQVVFTNTAPPGFVLFTIEAWKDYRDANESTWRDWRRDIYEPYWSTNSQPHPTVVSNRQVNIQALKVLVDTMQNAETNWPSLTAGQIQGLVRVHNQFLLRLKPLLQELYQEHLTKE